MLAGGRLNVLKLVKLLYLAERRSLADFAAPLIGDVAVSMKHGPVLSRTLDLINGAAFGDTGDWDRTIADRADHFVGLRLDSGPPSFGALSRADLAVIDRTWAEFGTMTKWDLVDYCHKHLREWEDPGDSSTPIPLRRIFGAVGYADEQIDAAVAALNEQAALRAACVGDDCDGYQF